MRLQVAQQWMAPNDRECMYAGPAKGADVAAWKQSLLAEAARSVKLPYARTLRDLVKAFDSVPCDCLVKQGDQLWLQSLLRLSIASYLLGRVLDIGGDCLQGHCGGLGVSHHRTQGPPSAIC